MKLKFLFLALFAAGVAASVALAAPSDHGRGKGHGKGHNNLVAQTGTTATTATTATTTGEEHHGKGKNKATRCRQVELRGTLTPTALSVKIDRASGPGRSLVGKTATLAAGSRVRVSARLCPDGTLQLRQLKTEKPRETPPTTTTAPTTTTGSTTTAATTTTG